MSDATFICRCEYIGKDKWKLDLLANAKPILFNTEMVRAILEGRKTVSRRVIKPQPPKNAHSVLDWDDEYQTVDFLCSEIRHDGVSKFAYTSKAPFWPGDTLYVKETFCAYEKQDIIYGVKYAYKADATPYSERARKDFGYKWRPSIHMPREAARIFLRVKSVGVERLQNMTEEDAVAEGFEAIKCEHPCGCPCTDCMDTGYLEPAMLGFVETWNSTIKPKDCALYGWEASPWVWVIGFERINKEEI